MSTTNKTTSTMDDSVEIKPYSPGELARLYRVSTRTLQTWLKPHKEAIGKRESLYYTALQVKIIFDKIGLPSTEAKD